MAGRIAPCDSPRSCAQSVTWEVVACVHVARFRSRVGRPRLLAGLAAGEERIKRFDRDPGWEGVTTAPPTRKRVIQQNFGYSAGPATPAGSPARSAASSPAAEPAWYAARSKRSLRRRPDGLEASGLQGRAVPRPDRLLRVEERQRVGGRRTPSSCGLTRPGRRVLCFRRVSPRAAGAQEAMPGGFAPSATRNGKDESCRGFQDWRFFSRVSLR